MNVFRKIGQAMERSNRLVAAETEYNEQISELRYRRSKAGRKFHDEASIHQQYLLIMELRERIRLGFGIELEAPEL